MPGLVGDMMDIDMRDVMAATDKDEMGGRPIDPSKPQIQNEDGSVSTERTITIEADGKHYVIPTIVNGKVLDEETAIQLFQKGQNPPVGVFATAQEADSFARNRSDEIGNALQQNQNDEETFEAGFQSIRHDGINGKGPMSDSAPPPRRNMMRDRNPNPALGNPRTQIPNVAPMEEPAMMPRQNMGYNPRRV